MIVAACLAALLAVGGAVYVGIQSFDGVVTDNPYEKGLRWDEEKKQEEDTGWSVDIRGGGFTTGENILQVSVRDRAGGPLPDAVVVATVSRPSTSEYDRDYPAVKLGNGLFQAPVSLPLYGYWDIKIHVAGSGHNAVYEKRIYAEKKVR